MTPIARIVSIAERSTYWECWLWPGSVSHDGYARTASHGKHAMIHRLAYEHFVGPIPDGAKLDHSCPNRHCFNPGHLEPVSHQTNLLRGDAGRGTRRHEWQCRNGHVRPPGVKCRECHNESNRRYAQRRAVSHSV